MHTNLVTELRNIVHDYLLLLLFFFCRRLVWIFEQLFLFSGRVVLLVVLRQCEEYHCQLFPVDFPVVVVIHPSQYSFLEVLQVVGVIILQNQQRVIITFCSLPHSGGYTAGYLYYIIITRVTTHTIHRGDDNLG